MSALAAAIEATQSAGWQLPVSVQPCTWRGFTAEWEVIEADDTRICIVGTRQDADLIAAALNHVLGAA